MSSNKPITKKIINSPETCVDDNLRGLVATYPALKLHPKHRVVTLRSKGDSKRVAVLGGGGSGHEPFAAGFIGKGMLDGAVAGAVFASPPTGHVLYAIASLYKNNSGGVIVLIGNYTGDRLNFGKAIEKAKTTGIKVEGLIVGEDVASSDSKTGGRSMCGEVILYKLCGAMSIKGYELSKIREIAAGANKYMATLSVCLSACSLPGQPPLFEINDDEVELGAGVHGEAGIAKFKMGTAKEIVQIILDEVVGHLNVSSDDRVAVMIDNLGGTSFLEMNIIAAEVKDYLVKKQVTVERIFSGHVKTSLEMPGFQICLLHLNKEHGDLWLELLDAPTTTPGWIGNEVSVKGDDTSHGDDDAVFQTDVRKLKSGPSLSNAEQKTLSNSLEAACEALIKNEALLNKLDSGCGDGDCGNTLKKFAQGMFLTQPVLLEGESGVQRPLGVLDYVWKDANATLQYIKTASFEYPSNVLWDLSELAETDMGGTSGGIYSLGLAAASQAIGKSLSSGVELWLSALQSAMEAITKYGGAEPGDRTMLDTLFVATSVYKQNMNNGLETLLLKTADASERGAKATATMVARAGRASYVASGYTQDEDAGARAVAIWFQAAIESIQSSV